MKPARQQQQRQRGVTLMELLVVIAIIAIISMIGVPAMKNSAKTDAMGTANRQLLDDIAYARAHAIRNRSTVFVLFLPGDYWNLGSLFKQKLLSNADPEIKQQYEKATALLGLQRAGYAVFAFRRAGDQPGQNTPSFVRDWQSLPQGIFFADGDGTTQAKRVGFSVLNGVSFPNETSPVQLEMPCIIFNHMGQVVDGDNKLLTYDAILPLARGNVNPARDAKTKEYLWDKSPSPVEDPPNNSVNNYNHIRIDWLTGRARVERPELN